MFKLFTLPVAALMLATTNVAAAQDRSDTLDAPRPGIGLYLGYTDLEEADGTAELGIYGVLGPSRSNALRLLLGVSRISSNSDRPFSDGSFTDVTVSANVRFQPFRVNNVQPFLVGGLGVHLLSNTATNPLVSAIYDGVNLGAQIGVGALVKLRDDASWSLTGEFDRILVQNLNRTSLRVGALFGL